MDNRIEQIVIRLVDKGAETAVFFRGLPPEAWSVQVYDTGSGWDVRQVLCHFVSAEQAYAGSIRDALGGGEGTPEDFVIDEFNEREVSGMSGLPPAELLDRFQATRAEVVALVRGMDGADLDREGNHPFFGRDRVEKFLRLIYRHNMIHERDVRRALQTHCA